MSSERCCIPWKGMSISHSGHVNVGCYPYDGIPKIVDVTRPLPLDEFWNSPFFREIRKVYAAEESPSGCAGCVQTHRWNEIDTVPEGLTPEQLANWKKAAESFAGKEEEVSHLPCHYNFCFSTMCNLKCIMCSYAEARDMGPFTQISADMLLGNEDTIALAADVEVGGGEVLWGKESRKFVHYMLTRPKLIPVGLTIPTNGMLLNRYFDVLPNKERLHVGVSLDGFKDTYEFIRQKGNWKQVSSNIEHFMELKEKLNKKHWTLNASAVLMKSSLERLDELVDWCTQRHVRCIFHTLLPTRETQDQCVEQNRALLDEVPGWEDKVLRAKEILLGAGYDASARQLDAFLERVKAPVEQKEVRVSSNISLSNFQKSHDVDGKRVVIWGTGTFYRNYIRDWMQRNRERMVFEGFVDNNPDMWGKTVDGARVMSPDELAAGSEPDIVILSLQLLWRDKIVEQLSSLGIHNALIV